MSNPLIPDTKFATLITLGDGAKTTWDINFASGYLSQAHIKAFITRLDGSYQIIDPVVFIGPQTVQVIPAVAAGATLTIYRDTPKAAALVDYSDGSIINEANLDKTARQSVFVSAEVFDRLAGVNAVSEQASIDSKSALTTSAAAAVQAAAADAKATTALANSSTAMATASAADVKATNALATATGFDARLSAAEADAENALTTATGVDAKATQALSTANSANTTANAASVNADQALTAALGVDAKATQALSTAQTANQNASQALSVAGQVDAKADLAISTANNAISQATTAVSVANAAADAVANKQDALGFTPVRQAGTDTIALSYASAQYLKASVNGADYGTLASLSKANSWAQTQSFTSATATGTITAAGNITGGMLIAGPSGGGSGRVYISSGALNRYIDINPANAMYNFVNSSQNSAVGQLSDSGIWFGTEFRPSSDARLKDTWEYFPDNFTESLAAVRAGSYRLKRTGERSVGVEAQGLQEVIPDAVGVSDDGMLNVNVGGAALAAVVYLARKLVDLEARIKAMESAQ